jgi:hypothetical protein
MLVSSGGSGSSSVLPDEYEIDSWENPVSCEIGLNENALPMNRTLTEGDEDFFLFVPERSGRLTMETTGSTDTYMEFYNYESRTELASNDDGGSGSNARIRHSVQAGTRYIAKVRGYSSSTTGSYGFRAFMVAPRETDNSWENPLSYVPGVDENATAVSRSLTEGDEDFFLIVPESSGRLTMETTGSIDTFMEFYNYETRTELARDDDGGSGSNARIRYNVQAGTRYIAKVRGYDDSTTGSYSFRAYMPAPREGDNSWENPLSYVPGTDENATVVSRSFQDEGEEDFFLIVPERNGRLTVETTGSMDTYMEFYDYDANELLEENDDNGQGFNARIRYDVRAGKRYLVKIFDLNGGSGTYGLRAYISQ